MYSTKLNKLNARKVRDIQKEDIDRNFYELLALEQDVQKRYVSDMPNLMVEMDALLNEQKRYLSGYDYACITDICDSFSQEESMIDAPKAQGVNHIPFADENTPDEIFEINYAEHMEIPKERSRNSQSSKIRYFTNPDTRLLERLQDENYPLFDERKFDGNEQLYMPYNIYSTPTLSARTFTRPASSNKPLSARSSGNQSRRVNSSMRKLSTKKSLPLHTLRAYAPLKFAPSEQNSNKNIVRPSSSGSTRKPWDDNFATSNPITASKQISNQKPSKQISNQKPRKVIAKQKEQMPTKLKDGPTMKYQQQKAIYRAIPKLNVKNLGNNCPGSNRATKEMIPDLCTTQNVKIFTPRDLPSLNTRYNDSVNDTD